MFSRLEVSSLSSAAPLESIGNFNIIYLSLFLLTGYVQSTGAFCPEHHWWQGELNACTPCTVCDKSQSIVLRPCSLHLDAICGTLDDLELELSWLQSAVEQQRVEKNPNLIEKSSASMMMWDWQSLSLALAAFMCVLFFIVAGCIFWQHSRYWKKLEKMEKGYNAEAEELSSRLMHTIIDIRNDGNGRVVLEEAKKDKVTNPFDLQCIYFEDLLDNENGNKKLVPKPLIKINPKKSQQTQQGQQHPNQHHEHDDVHAIKPHIENETMQRQGRGNCYIDPIHQNNCVTSELYLIT